jgi:hypothetical protein
MFRELSLMRPERDTRMDMRLISLFTSLFFAISKTNLVSRFEVEMKHLNVFPLFPRQTAE